MLRLMAALAVYAVLGYAAGQTLTAKVPVGEHAVELRVIVWVVLGAFALLTVMHRRDRTDAAKSGEK
jgi:membrane protein DedA with SNARE-associated domain